MEVSKTRPTTTSKSCDCGETRAEEFYKGHAACKACVIQRTASWVKANPHRHWANQVLLNSKVRAKASGVQHTLTLEWVFRRAITTPYCPVLGIKLDYERHSRTSRGPRPNSPSVDRINPDLGYVPGNVWIISQRANSMKARQNVEYVFQRAAMLEAV